MMRIAIVHSFYSSEAPSGENEAVREQAAALERAGHEVALIAAHTDALQRAPLYPLRAAVTVATGHGLSPLRALRACAPDVVHVHNLFPNFGRSWLHEWGGPLVATVHNFRPLCAVATLYRDGATCTRCPDGDRWAGLRFGCYRSSRAATAPLAWANRGGATADGLLRRADRIVVLSEHSRNTYVRAGLGAERLVAIPNFVSKPASDDPSGPGQGAWAFVGRLSAEKGILTLLNRWPAGEPLDVVGDGELRDACRATAPDGVRFLGSLERAALRRRMPCWRGLVFPSRCRENAPLVYAEALAAGLPVLAFAGSTVADAVRDSGTGAVTSWDEPLRPVLAAATRRFPSLRDTCRRVFAEGYSEPAWVTRTARLYADVIAPAGAVRGVV
jgi:glycosyltransferase involved in cell wall biosynthesis